MTKTKRPARKGQGVMCQLPGDTDVPSKSAARAQFLSRFGIPFHRCGLIGALYFGEGRCD